ncbi:MAG: hypothetical protein LBH70_10700 [Spirochaetaceae bacterium]|jgi:hypothetical protein|nr:hypothetical protein [Spirochaetaceae bacterium]
MKDSGMTGNGGMNLRTRAALLTALFLVTALPGCFNPAFIETPDSADHSSGLPSKGAGLGEPDPFTITLSLGDGPESRSIVGPDSAAIQYGHIRNIAQVIVMDAEGKTVVDFAEARRNNEKDKGADIRVKNVSKGNTYRFLVLMGHLERDYTTLGENFVYTDKPPTLLAAGSAKTIIHENQASITITMYPLVVDTVFVTNGEDRWNAALPKNGETALPVNVDGEVIWTVGGRGFTSLINAHAGITGTPADPNDPNDPNDNRWELDESKESGGIDVTSRIQVWRGNTWEDGETSGTLIPYRLGHNQITLAISDYMKDLGNSVSAAFNLKYVPFWKENGEDWRNLTSNASVDENHVPVWIIRNGVNDEAQNEDTNFSISNTDPDPWKGTKNGNGAVVFTVKSGGSENGGGSGNENGSGNGSIMVVTDTDLTPKIPVPKWGGDPLRNFRVEPQYEAVTTWVPDDAIFEPGKEYTLTLRLQPIDPYTFVGMEPFSYTSDRAANVEYNPLPEENSFEVIIPFKPTRSFIQFSGDPNEPDSAVDWIRAVAEETDRESLTVDLNGMSDQIRWIGKKKEDGCYYVVEPLRLNGDSHLREVIIDGGNGGAEIILADKAIDPTLIFVDDGVSLTLKNITFLVEDGSSYDKWIVGGGTWREESVEYKHYPRPFDQFSGDPNTRDSVVDWIHTVAKTNEESLTVDLNGMSDQIRWNREGNEDDGYYYVMDDDGCYYVVEPLRLNNGESHLRDVIIDGGDGGAEITLVDDVVANEDQYPTLISVGNGVNLTLKNISFKFKTITDEDKWEEVLEKIKETWIVGGGTPHTEENVTYQMYNN